MRSTRATVMVVDDEARVCDMLALILREEGYRVVTAHSGGEAVALALATRPALVLLDILMPKPDGIATLRALKDSGLGAAVIVITGHGTLATARAAMRLSALHYVTKPFDLEFLKATVRAALGASAPAPRAEVCAL